MTVHHSGSDEWRGKYVRLFLDDDREFTCKKSKGGVIEVDDDAKEALQCKVTSK